MNVIVNLNQIDQIKIATNVVVQFVVKIWLESVKSLYSIYKVNFVNQNK
jgi:hypothetical protein